MIDDPELKALAGTLKQRFTMHLKMAKETHVYSHEIIGPDGKTVAVRSMRNEKGKTVCVVFTMDGKGYEGSEAFLIAYQQKLRDQDWETAAPKKDSAA